MPGARSENTSVYTKDLYAAMFEGYDALERIYPKVFKVVEGVNGPGHKETQLIGAGDLVRHTSEGQDVVFKSPVQGWEFLVKYSTFSDGLALHKEAVEDTVKLGNFIRDLGGPWGVSVRDLEETVAARVFNQGGATAGDWVFNGTHTGNSDSSGDLLYDSFPLFNLTGNARSTKKASSTYYNAVSGLTLTPDNFETLYNLAVATNNRDERERRINFQVDALLTERGAERFKAERIIDTSKGLPSSQSNDINPYYKIVEPMDWAYLSDSSAFYIGKKQHRDFMFHKRQEPEIRYFRDETNLGYKASINVRFGIFIKNWRCWVRGGGTYA